MSRVSGIKHWIGGVRLVHGWREVAFLGGLLVGWIGAAFLGSYSIFKEPSVSEQAFDPDVRGVTYPIDRWPMTLGVSLVILGTVCCAVAWFSARPWAPGDPPTVRVRQVHPIVAAVVLAAGAAVPMMLVRTIARH